MIPVPSGVRVACTSDRTPGCWRNRRIRTFEEKLRPGGYLLLGDDHASKSSTLPHQSDHHMVAAMLGDGPSTIGNAPAEAQSSEARELAGDKTISAATTPKTTLSVR